MIYSNNLEKHLLLLQIAEHLENIKSDSIFSISVRIALQENRIKEIVKEIHEQSKDNRPLVSDIVGEKVLLKIEKYFSL